MTKNSVLEFWFEELNSEQWWKKDDKLDLDIKKRFEKIHFKARKCELHSWRESAEGRLAEIIVLDQFSRNIYRDTKLAFAFDSMALVLAQETVSLGEDHKLNDIQKSFLYMPYMHSESQLIHEEAMKLYSQKGLEFNLEFEKKHKKIIDRFGRYPHRNEILSRPSTEDELEFLKEPESSF